MDINQNISNLVNQLASDLTSSGQIISTAESCTGGMIAQYFTALAGSSAWFEYGFITYSNKAKQDLVGVSENSLQTFGAVSQQVVEEMALGALRKSQAHYAVAVSGIAGPTGAVEGKPVGTVCIGVSGHESSEENKLIGQIVECTESQTYHFNGNREEVRLQACLQALLDVKQFMKK